MKAYADKYRLPKELGTARKNLLTPLTFFNDDGKTTNRLRVGESSVQILWS